MKINNIPSPEELRRIIIEESTANGYKKNSDIVVDEQRAKAYFKILDAIKEDINTQDVTIGNGIFRPFQSMAYISVNGKEIVFNNLNECADDMSFVSNIEIVAFTDEEVTMSLTFHGIVKQK